MLISKAINRATKIIWNSGGNKLKNQLKRIKITSEIKKSFRVSFFSIERRFFSKIPNSDLISICPVASHGNFWFTIYSIHRLELSSLAAAVVVESCHDHQVRCARGVQIVQVKSHTLMTKEATALQKLFAYAPSHDCKEIRSVVVNMKLCLVKIHEFFWCSMDLTRDETIKTSHCEAATPPAPPSSHHI